MCTNNAQTRCIYNAEKHWCSVIIIFGAYCKQGLAMMYLTAISQYGQHNFKFKNYFMPDTPSQMNVQIKGLEVRRRMTAIGAHVGLCVRMQDCVGSLQCCLTYSQGDPGYGLHCANPSYFMLNVSVFDDAGAGVVV